MQTFGQMFKLMGEDTQTDHTPILAARARLFGQMVQPTKPDIPQLPQRNNLGSMFWQENQI